MFLLLTLMFTGVAISADKKTDMKARLVLYKEKVNAAAQLINKEGAQSAERKILDKKGDFFFDSEQGYIFIIDSTGNTILNAAKPALKGKNLLGVKDVKGVAFFNLFIKMAQKHENGWVAYSWPKPGAVEAAAKVSYVKMLKKDGVEYIIGAGPYDVTKEDILKLFPEEAKKAL
ncbi:MAG: hypothetical protein A2X42_01450 [Candidatus Margulisbacteria bacterium GWF2_38_17]|nr:MAG: hypothetical protein A2X43_12835 [Candidatus Margulisbacteria bacterium GWD2_39_127]OGI02114.1 MAG: hypothetical protein A2X42_01450 [Candidatus Margulisbacteria bacterium GWF2_38_17]OGI10491.1 MAG: hypothetical protein A2X41_06950 [Candidatus Margulisbacteria bacterium GWE2_39_32]